MSGISGKQLEDASVPPTKLTTPFGPTGPPGPPGTSELIYQPGGVPGGNIYTTDATALTAIQLVNGACKVIVDPTAIGFANVPWTVNGDLTSAEFIGKYPGTIIETSAGGFLLNPARLTTLAVTTFDPAVPAIQFAPASPVDMTFNMNEGASIVMQAGGAIQPMLVNLSGGKKFSWFADQCSSPVDVTAVPGSTAVSLAPNQSVNWWITRATPGMTVSAVVEGDPSSRLVILFDETVNPAVLNQPGCTGPVQQVPTTFQSFGGAQGVSNILYAIQGASPNGANGSIYNPYATLADAFAAAAVLLPGSEHVTILMTGFFSENVVWPDVSGIALTGLATLITGSNTVSAVTSAPAIGWTGGVNSPMNHAVISNIQVQNFNGGGVYFDGGLSATGPFNNGSLKLEDVNIDGNGIPDVYDFFINNVGQAEFSGGNSNSGIDSGVKCMNSQLTVDGNANINDLLAFADFTQPNLNPTLVVNFSLNVINFRGQGSAICVIQPGGNANNVDMSGLTSTLFMGLGIRGTFVCGGFIGSPLNPGGGSPGTCVINIPPDPGGIPVIDILPFLFGGVNVFSTFAVTTTSLTPVSMDCRGAKFSNASPGAIRSGSNVNLDLRGAVWSDAALAVAGSGTIDRSPIVIPFYPLLVTPVTVPISPPLPAGATYTVATATDQLATVSTPEAGKTPIGFQATASVATSCDFTITRTNTP